MDHNALNFGDVYSARAYQNIVLSTVQYNEKTLATDGILHPDIEIPYVASDFMYEKDPVL